MRQSEAIVAIILASGRGSRMGGGDEPKQYRSLGGNSVIQRAVSAFLRHSSIDHVLCVIHPDDAELYRRGVAQHSKLLDPVFGGATRQASGVAGLEALAEIFPSKVLIHDAARPFVDEATITRVIQAITPDRAALPAIPVSDTLKRADEGVVASTVDRNGLFAAQTPQGFDYQAILSAHRQAADEELNHFTDDTALAEWSGLSIVLVEGSTGNTKITAADDLARARRLHPMTPDIRTGHGYDTHRWAPGNSVWLCGVEIPHTHRLDGHSDADVGLHALTDALLATIGDGDIGSHFPPSDAQWKDARSDQFLAHAAGLINATGGTITHVDVTLVCEAPKIGPHRDEMRQAIATILTIEPARVSVKATTNETIGFIGRGEGMAALATATVVIGNDD